MTPDELIGTWKLLGNHHRSPEGAVLDAQFGPDPMGVIRFDANGRMIVVIADARVRLPDGLNQRPFSGYTGRWALNDDVLTTEVDESFLTQYVGSVQRREVVHEDGRLTLVPPPLVIDGVTHYRELVWEKIPGT
jgi:hypothetical protein